MIALGYRMIDDNIVEFYVKDTGTGIPPEHLESIFDRFRQVDELTVRPFPGTGLGLAITKKLVEMMGGTIGVESESGKGTTFSLRFPLAGKPRLSQEEKPLSAPAAATDWSKLNVLVVEDIDSNLELLEAILTSKNAKMYAAVTGLEAIEKIKQYSEINLVLMDIKLPEMDGFTAIREIRKIKPDIPVIVETAFSDEKTRRKAYEAGCNDFLTKPVTRRLLANALKDYL